jgi:uncharacterized protein YeaO (DUF488 family)
MKELYVLSAYETSAEKFFNTLKEKQVDLVLDIREKNESQLCGFTKKRDLEYFVRTIVGGIYVHDRALAPTNELLDPYLKHWASWEQYEEGYKALMEERDILSYFKSEYESYSVICLIGTETKKRRSHSEILYSMLLKHFKIKNEKDCSTL